MIPSLFFSRKEMKEEKEESKEDENGVNKEEKEMKEDKEVREEEGKEEMVVTWLLLLPLSCAPRCRLSSCCSSTQGPTEPPGGAAILLTS